MAYNPSVQGRQTLRPSATAIGTSYDAAPTAVKIRGQNTVTLLCDLTLDTATSVEIQVEIATPADTNGTNVDPAPVAADWFPIHGANLSGLTVGSGIITIPVGAAVFQLGATGKVAIRLKDLCASWIRVKAKTTGGPGATTLSIIGVEGLA